MTRFLLGTLSLVLIAFVGYSALASANTPAYQSPQFKDGKFANPVRMRELGFGEVAKIWWTFMFDKPAGTRAAGARCRVDALTAAF